MSIGQVTISGLTDEPIDMEDGNDNAKHTLMALNAAVEVLDHCGDHWSADLIREHLVERAIVE